MVGEVRRPGQRAHLPRRDVGDADLGAAQVVARREAEGHANAVRGDGGAPLVAVALQPRLWLRATKGRRPGVVRADHGEPRSVLALDRDDEPVVAEPDGAPPSTSFRGGPPSVETSQTWPWSAYATCEPSGERRGSVSSQYGIGSRPVVSRRGSRSARSSSQTSDVSRSWMKTQVRPSAPSVSERGRSVAAIASSRQCGGGFRSLRGCEGAPSTSSFPIQIPNGSGTHAFLLALLEALERGEHEPADRREIVPTLLHDHHGKRRGADDAAGLAIALRA